jgi:hypothetical protein
MFQVMLEYPTPWPENGPLRVEVQFAGEIAVSPALAKRHAAGFLAMEVSMAARAGTPVLITGQRPVWRIPACLHLPGSEAAEAPVIGSIDVDALTGDIILPGPNQIAAMQRHADALAAHHPLSPATAG